MRSTYEFDGLRVKKLHACDYIGVTYTINLLNIWLRILKIFIAENNEPSALARYRRGDQGLFEDDSQFLLGLAAGRLATAVESPQGKLISDADEGSGWWQQDWEYRRGQ